MVAHKREVPGLEPCLSRDGKHFDLARACFSEDIGDIQSALDVAFRGDVLC